MLQASLFGSAPPRAVDNPPVGADKCSGVVDNPGPVLALRDYQRAAIDAITSAYCDGVSQSTVWRLGHNTCRSLAKVHEYEEGEAQP